MKIYLSRISNRKSGSVLLMALVMGSLSLVVIASLLGLLVFEYKLTHYTTASEQAFHVAEAGVDRALHKIQYEGIGMASFWEDTGSSQLQGENGTFDVNIEMTGTNSYMIDSTGTWSYGGGKEADRRIQVAVEVVPSQSQNRSPMFPGFIFKDKVTIGHFNDDGTMITSWNSNDSVNPIFKPDPNANTGYDAVVASLSSDPGAIDLNTAKIEGSVGVATSSENANIKYKTLADYPNPNETHLPAMLKGPETPGEVRFDSDRILYNYQPELEPPVAPNPADYVRQETYDQNYWSNGGTNVEGVGKVFTLGEPGFSTYITAQNSFSPQSSTIVIKGDVVLYADGPINSNNITFKIEEGASLIIQPAAQASFNGNVHIDSQHPSQLLILQPINKQEIIIHTERFSGFINAPDSIVRLHGTGSNGNRNMYLGGIVGKELTHTNSFVMVADMAVSGQSSNESTPTGVIANVASWREVAVNKF